MTTIRPLTFAFLGIAACSGCGDSSPKPWESAKPQTAQDKQDDRNDGVNSADSQEPGSGDQAAKAGEVTENQGTLVLGSAHWTTPKSWVRKTPKSSIVRILAEYDIPKAEGDPADGRLTITQAGSTVEENIARWKKQFAEKLEHESTETIEAGGVSITLVDLAGTFNDRMSGTGPRPDYRLLGAIFQLPNDQSLTFVKCSGPKKTIAARADEIKGFLKSLTVDK